MAYTYLILTNQMNNAIADTRFLKAYIRDNGNPEVRLVEMTIPMSQALGTIDLAAAFAAGVVVPNGTALWNQLELEDTDTAGKGAIAAILDIVRASATPSLPAMTAAGLDVLNDHPKQLIAYNRVKSAIDAATLAQLKDFVSLLTVITYSKLAQRS